MVSLKVERVVQTAKLYWIILPSVIKQRRSGSRHRRCWSKQFLPLSGPVINSINRRLWLFTLGYWHNWLIKIVGIIINSQHPSKYLWSFPSLTFSHKIYNNNKLKLKIVDKIKSIVHFLIWIVWEIIRTIWLLILFGKVIDNYRILGKSRDWRMRVVIKAIQIQAG